MYLDGAARKWFFCSVVPVDWTDLPIRPDPGNAGANLPATTGLRTTFLREFQQANFAVFQEAKLRNRAQGLDEPTTSYYYDILDLCRVVNSAMPEAAKLEHLFRGLKPSLLEKIYPLKPGTCAEFLASVKIYAEAVVLANRRTWSDSVLRSSPAPALADPVAFIRQAPTSPIATPDQDLWKILRDLQLAVAELKNDRNDGASDSESSLIS
jgi:hypothetical protein